MLTIGQSIQARRKAAEMSVAELAQQSNVAIRTIYSWEKDRHAPRLLELWAVADVLGCSIDELIGRDQNVREQ